jgi:pyridoxine 5-phosphate synthase
VRPRLGINVDHVATIRQARRTVYPDPVEAAFVYSPDTVTLVPERREELTTEGGLDVNQHKDQIQRSVRLLQEGNIRVSLFIDADLDQVRAAHKIDAHAVEIHTGRYCEARGYKERHEELLRIQNAAKAAAKLGLGVAAGHGLHYQNTIPVARIQEIQELNIGHAIVARAMIIGMEAAVRRRAARSTRPRRSLILRIRIQITTETQRHRGDFFVLRLRRPLCRISTASPMKKNLPLCASVSPCLCGDPNPALFRTPVLNAP